MPVILVTLYRLYLSTVSSGGANPTSMDLAPNSSIIAVAVPVIVVILAIVVGTIVVVLVVVGLVFKKHRQSSYKPRSSSSSLSDGTLDSYNMLDVSNHNGRAMEMKERDVGAANFADPLDIPFEPSRDVTIENFKDHVEKYDAKRQLLFQEEFEVRA